MKKKMKSEKSSARMKILGRFLRTLTFEKKKFDPTFRMRNFVFFFIFL